MSEKIGTWAKFSSSMRRIVSHHVVDWRTKGSSPWTYPPRPDWDNAFPQDVRYPYVELKARGLVPVDRAVVCLYPKALSRTMNAWLDSVGFGGWRVPVRTPVVKKDERTEAGRRVWAAAMSDAIRSFVANPDQVARPERYRFNWKPKAVARSSFFGWRIELG